MTQKDKELLLKDLCSRLPYRVKCHFKYGSVEDDITLSCIDDDIARFEYGWYGSRHVTIEPNHIKPYLRPMSSMTEEEKKEYYVFSTGHYLGVIDEDTAINFIDWLNTHHFDYRGLIEKGLALVATDDMYKINKE